MQILSIRLIVRKAQNGRTGRRADFPNARDRCRPFLQFAVPIEAPISADLPTKDLCLRSRETS